MCNFRVSPFTSGGIYTQYSIKKDNYTRIFLDTNQDDPIILSSNLPNPITFMMEQKYSMGRVGKIFKGFLITLAQGALLYIVFLLITWFTWWLTGKLWMPIFTLVLKGISLLSLVSGAVTYILFIVFNTKKSIEEIYGKDCWQRIRRFLRI